MNTEDIQKLKAAQYRASRYHDPAAASSEDLAIIVNAIPDLIAAVERAQAAPPFDIEAKLRRAFALGGTYALQVDSADGRENLKAVDTGEELAKLIAEAQTAQATPSIDDFSTRILPPAGLEGYIVTERYGFLVWSKRGEAKNVCFYDGDCRDVLTPAEFDRLMRARSQAAPLPKWIDELKGNDPTTDDLIAYMEGIHPSQAAPQVDPARQRIADYIERREKTAQLDIEHIHSFDLGPDCGVELLLSDLKALVAAPQVATPAGWRFVPEVPDEEMLRQIKSAMDPAVASARHIWRMALAAAPAAPSPAVQVQDERAAFEAAMQHVGYNMTMDAAKPGEYAFPPMRAAWSAWQARAALTATPSPSVQSQAAQASVAASTAQAQPYGWINAGTDQQQTTYATLNVGAENPWVDGANAFPVFRAVQAQPAVGQQTTCRESHPSTGFCDSCRDGAYNKCSRVVVEQDAVDAARDKQRLNFIENSSVDLRCHDAPTGGDDYDIVWTVTEHYMTAPKEREIGFGNSAREAIDAAINSQKG
ncbi:MAG: hypothetical protein JO253_04660 [Alphaproteobacteria bacterium]|nr:hypothetical protein [Alphaproteobacteria bacterium]